MFGVLECRVGAVDLGCSCCFVVRGLELQGPSTPVRLDPELGTKPHKPKNHTNPRLRADFSTPQNPHLQALQYNPGPTVEFPANPFS